MNNTECGIQGLIREKKYYDNHFIELMTKTFNEWLPKFLNEPVKCNVHMDFAQYVGITDSKGRTYWIDFHYNNSNEPQVKLSKGCMIVGRNRRTDVTDKDCRRVKEAVKKVLELTYEI